MNTHPSQSSLAELLSLNALMVTQHAELSATIARTQKLIVELAVSNLNTASPEPLQAITRALDIQGSDRGGESGALRRSDHEPGSEQTPTAEAQGRNEPASVEVVAGATAGEVGNASSPAPRGLKREIILDLWNEGKLTPDEIAERAGSTLDSIKGFVNAARRAGDARALHKRCPRHVPTIAERQAEKKNATLDAFADGMTMPDIAVKLRVSLEAVKSIVRRARIDGDERASIRRVTAPKEIQEFADSMRIPAKPPAAEPKPRIMSTKEVMARLAGEVAARAVKPAPAPYSQPMEPSEAKPIPKAELPAPVPVLKLDPEIIMLVADGVVHGPGGIEERLTTPQLMILTRMADGGMYPDKVLSDISGATNGTFTYLMNGMRAKLAGIGVEIFQPMKGFWRARRAS